MAVVGESVRFVELLAPEEPTPTHAAPSLLERFNDVSEFAMAAKTDA